MRFTNKVNKSHRQSNIFSQHKKRCHIAPSYEPARVDAPGRAISKAERRRVARAPGEALSEEQLWPALTAAAAPTSTDGAGRASFLVPCLPPVPGGAAARVGDDAGAAPPDEARGAKRARHAE